MVRRRFPPRDSPVAVVDVAPPEPSGLELRVTEIHDRLARLEERVDARERAAFDQADSDNVIDLRLHSARLAAELTRITVELRAEIDELARQVRALAGRSGIAPRDDTGAAPPGDSIDVVDLTERRARSSTGWKPID
jgi:hypothetical protein